QDGLRRMVQEQEDVFYYITTLNENYQHPDMPEGAENGIVKGMYLLRGSDKPGQKVHLMGCGAILNEVVAGAEMLEQDFGLSCDVWSVTSFTELRREAEACERWNMLHPTEEPRVPYVAAKLKERGEAPVVASTDYVKLFADQIRPYVDSPYRVLGTDGFGRSDYRKKLREHFEVDRNFVALAAMKSLHDAQKVPASAVQDVITKYGINPEKPDPATA
ncbi:MAG: pyruvate dehydrogenase (acetyl-transferring), homodimeric type, partial [Pseudomonadota bacterium]